MFKIRFNKNGVVLLITLGMLLVVMALISVILSIITSQSRLTHHQSSRIQAYYASQAGINYAIEKLRLGTDPDWPASGVYTRRICKSGCSSPNINEDDLPSSIQYVDITVYDTGSGISGTRKISATANYTYTPS